MKAILATALLLASAWVGAQPVDSLRKAQELSVQQPDKHILVYYKNNAS